MKAPCLLTGGASVIGREISRRFLRDPEFSGSPLFRTTTDPSKLEGESLRADFSDPAQVEGLVAALKSRAPLGGAIFAAGINQDDSLSRLSEEAWDRVWAVDFKAHARLALGLADTGVWEARAPLVLVGSIVGQRGNAGQVAYAAAKGALAGLRDELCRRGFRANLLLPPLVESPLLSNLGPEARERLFRSRLLQDPDPAASCAEAALFLLSKRSSYINNQTWHADSRVSSLGWED